MDSTSANVMIVDGLTPDNGVDFNLLQEEDNNNNNIGGNNDDVDESKYDDNDDNNKSSDSSSNYASKNAIVNNDVNVSNTTNHDNTGVMKSPSHGTSNVSHSILVENATPFSTTTTPATGLLNRSFDSVLKVDRKSEIHHKDSIDGTGTILPQQQQYRSIINNRLQLALPPPTIMRMDNNGGMLNGASSVDNDCNFAELVKERTRLRREREDAALSNLTVQVSRLEAALQAESKRRTKAIHSIQQQAVQEIQQTEDMIRKQMHEETIAVEKRLVAIEERVTALEKRWNSDVTAISTDLERNRREIDSQLKDLYQSADRERQARISREKVLEKQLIDTSTDFQERWTKERQDRLVAVSTIEDAVTEQAKVFEQITTSYEQKVQYELQSLVHDIEREILERQTNDDEIVAALNRYTAQLQQTLSYATSM